MDRQDYPLFPPQLPPPSHIHLPLPHSSASFRSNTLPPLVTSRFPPASYHPSLSSPYAPNNSSQPHWPMHHSPSARDDIKPPLSDNPKSKSADTPSNPDRIYRDHPKDPDDGMPPTSDFVKKLYKMLQDRTFSDVVCWAPGGDSFIIKDMTEFTKSILPRMFKHSNFASFVRQLNKYDFHKVKNNEENTFGEHSWTFRHPDFRADCRDALENIKRKVPSQRKSTPKSSNPAPAGAASPSSPVSPPESDVVQRLQTQIDRLTRSQDEMTAQIRGLERNYQSVLSEMVNFQRNMAQQDGLMQNLIQYFLQLENGKQKDEAPATVVQLPLTENQFVPASEAQRIMGGVYQETDVARASFEQMNEIARRASTAGMQFSPPGMTPPPSGSPAPRTASPFTRQDTLQRIEELQRARPASAQGQGQTQGPQEPQAVAGFPSGDRTDTDSALTSEVPFPGLQVYTVGHLLPRSAGASDDGTWSFDPAALQLPEPPTDVTEPSSFDAPPSSSSSSNNVTGLSTSRRPPTPQRLRVRRSTFVPGWAVPPRVLLVDDDAVNRKLSSKFLQVFGCTIDVAVDGVSAVNKMNLEKYDLVLMDIVMPKLDGLSATSLIRQFDSMTPIISMTSNSKPTEILRYYSHGMNDILPKPFTKEGLLDMLEKHLMHLKVIQELAKGPPAAPAPHIDARINPLAGLGLSDEQYTQILQNIVSGDDGGVDDGGGGGKRPLELEDGEDGREEKRGRFQVIE